MSSFDFEGSAVNFVNGELVRLTAKGRGSVEEGTVESNWDYSSDVDGFPDSITPMCTNFGASLFFAIERNGGLNMHSLSGGNYRMYRVLDFGPYGSYDLRAEIRTSGRRVTARGVTFGSMRLPQGITVPTSLVEVMFPAAQREIRSFMGVTLTDRKGDKIAVSVPSVYSPLSKDDEDWTRAAKLQVRRSFVRMKREADKLAIVHSTIIEGIREPSFPSSRAFEGAEKE